MTIDLRLQRLEADPYGAYDEILEHGGFFFDEASSSFYVCGHSDVGKVISSTDYQARGVPAWVADYDDAGVTSVGRVERFLSSWMVFDDSAAHAVTRDAVRLELRPSEALQRRLIAKATGILATSKPQTLFDWNQDYIAKLARAAIAEVLEVSDVDASFLISFTDAAFTYICSAGDVEVDADRAQPFVEEFEAWSQGYLGSGTRFAATLNEVGQNDSVSLSSIIGVLAQVVTGALDPLISATTSSILLARRFGVEASRAVAPSALLTEAIRLHPPFHFAPRVARSNIRLGGHSLKSGDRVLAVIASANRDPDVWTDASEFRPERQATSLSFGRGAHSCIGAALATTISNTALSVAIESEQFAHFDPDAYVREPSVGRTAFVLAT